MSPGPNSQSMDASSRIPLNIEISCGDENNSEVGSGKYDPSTSSYNFFRENEVKRSDRDWCDHRNVELTENLRLFTGTGCLSRQRHAESLHKIHMVGGGGSGAASRNVIVNNEPRNFPLTKGYLNAANRHLAASTLKLWQGEEFSRKNLFNFCTMSQIFS